MGQDELDAAIQRSLSLGRRPDEFGEQRVIVVIARGNDQAVTNSEHHNIAGSDALSGLFRCYARLEFADNHFRVGRFVHHDIGDFHGDRQILHVPHPFPELLPSLRRGRLGNHEWVLDDDVVRVAFVDDLRLTPFRDRVYEPVKYSVGLAVSSMSVPFVE